jgi:prepilin-type N-terminal cleavage/methylation domain-containing protein
MLISSPPSRANLRFRRGFSLVEIAVVLVIIAILVTAVGAALSSQLDQQRTLDTQRQLDSIKEAIYGFAMANGRLPCPATSTSAGQERFCTNASGGCGTPTTVQTHGRCVTSFGFVPARTLSLAPIDSGGFAVDAWDDGTAAHRIFYSVSDYQDPADTYVLTAPDGIRAPTMASVSVALHLFVCSTGLTAVPPTTNCSTMTTLTDKAPFVIYSLGKSTAQNSNDETNNQNGDRVFTSGTPTATFDDIVTWGSLNTLFSRMVQAGKLP